jgi:ATPase subunit of ABC transporter with duplicated ATPase domains
MTLEQAILAQVRNLTPEEQQQVLDFAETLAHRQGASPAQVPEPVRSNASGSDDSPTRERTLSLGQRLRALRAQIVASGEPLLTPEEIQHEISEQRERLGPFEV